MTWKFDRGVAETFVAHARQHIPNYDSVIDKSVEICKYALPTNARIIDVGCATGETLRRLHSAGFTDLHGVDASADMLAYCDPSIAKYYHSEQLPADKFDAVICNWTLHFVKDKVQYLSAIQQSLSPGGFLILSDKTSLDTLPIHFYHELKRQNGVSETAIAEKARSVETVMHIDDAKWYLDTLKSLNFGKTHIIDANWCFTSFLCFK